MNPGERRNREPQGSGKGFRHGEPLSRGLATDRQQRGQFISQPWLSSESAARGRGARRPEGAAVSRRQADLAVVNTLEGNEPLDLGLKVLGLVRS